MFLKSLKLIGFKSFADRTRLEFLPGVSVVVGPNGSGKSNLVDAVAWVMGTQSPTALRTERMEDVIFAGTTTRRPLGRSEVTLTFDNASRLLPLDLDEVEITRRLYRDGSSEYLINDLTCRLIDVQELLSDSGVGRHQHTIVGQGRIEAILNAKPEDHRAVIEEAAGVLKYRLRKDRAIRRLERARSDLTRLRDIHKEMSRSLRPLKRQARAAERYEGVREAVRGHRLYLDGRELSRIGEDLAAARDEENEIRHSIEHSELEFEEITSSIGAHEAEAQRTRDALERDTAAAARLETGLERLRRIGQVAHERHRAATTARLGADERREALEAEQTDLYHQLSAAERDEHDHAEAEASAAAELRSLEEEDRSLAEAESLSPEGAAALLEGELTALELRAARDRAETEATRLGLDQILAQQASNDQEIARLEADIRRLDVEAGSAQDRYGNLADISRESSAEYREAEVGRQEAEMGEATARVRVESLRAIIDRPAAPAPSHPRLKGKVVDLLDVPADLLAPVEAALQSWAESVAVDSAESLPALIEELAGEGSRGVPVVLISETPKEPPIDDPALGPLIEQLGPSAHRRLAAQLLGDTVLCESWRVAWKLVQRHPSLRAVTPDGDLITSDGLKLADPESATPALLGEAHGELEAAETALAREKSRETTTARALRSHRDAEREALEALEAWEASLAGATEALRLLNRTAATLQQDVASHERRIKSLQDGMKQTARQTDVLGERLAEVGSQAEVEAWHEMSERRSTLSGLVADTKLRRDGAGGSLAATRERRRLLEVRLLQLETESSKRLGIPHREDVGRLARIEETASRAAAVVESHLAMIRDRQRGLAVARDEAAHNLSSAHQRRELLRSETESGKTRSGELAVQITEWRLRVETIAEGLSRDLDTTPEVALAAPEPALAENISHHSQLDSLQAELRRLGPVNPLAAAEFGELSERVGFLNAQIEDLSASRRRLLKLISRLDAEISAQFVAAFEEVAGHFERHFALLFPGGKGRLAMVDPEDVLRTGVDMFAQPLGKKVGKLSLLSGGERSLAALAFLFAVFRARPSPFYILDEVEAALDDANLRRFLRLIDEFRENAQLVVITHQQQTMEAADVLYGVTMEPGGSSQAVSKQMRERITA